MDKLRTPCWLVVGICILLANGCAERKTDMTFTRGIFPEARELAPVTHVHQCRYQCAITAVRGPNGIVGYLFDEVVVSRSGPFRIRVAIGSDVRVRNATVTSYPGERGREVRLPSFAKQFDGKGSNDAIRLGTDIDAATGATISSRIMADGVRHALQVVGEMK